MNPMLVVVVQPGALLVTRAGLVGLSPTRSPLLKNTQCVDEGFRPTAYVNVARGNFTLQLSEGGNWIRL